MGVSDIMCKVTDVQLFLSPIEKLGSLGDLYSKTFKEKLVLSKAWRISGWDNPVLHSRQEEYAALDVVCLYKLAKYVCPQM